MGTILSVVSMIWWRKFHCLRRPKSLGSAFLMILTKFLVISKILEPEPEITKFNLIETIYIFPQERKIQDELKNLRRKIKNLRKRSKQKNSMIAISQSEKNRRWKYLIKKADKTPMTKKIKNKIQKRR